MSANTQDPDKMHGNRNGADPQPERNWQPAAMMVATGATSKHIAETLGIGISTVRGWRRRPGFKRYVNELVDEIMAIGFTKLYTGFTKAIDKLVALIDDPNVEMQYKASMAVIERASKRREFASVDERLAELEHPR